MSIFIHIRHVEYIHTVQIENTYNNSIRKNLSLQNIKVQFCASGQIIVVFWSDLVMHCKFGPRKNIKQDIVTTKN
jgi:hypothetical protein